MYNISHVICITISLSMFCIPSGLHYFLFVFSKHHELAQQLEEQTDRRRVQNYVQLERELQTLVDQIEMKAKQINTVRKHLWLTPTKPKTSTSQQCSARHSPRDVNVKLLQKMKALRSTLQEDDLCWD